MGPAKPVAGSSEPHYFKQYRDNAHVLLEFTRVITVHGTDRFDKAATLPSPRSPSAWELISRHLRPT